MQIAVARATQTMSKSLNIFSETFHDNLPVARAKQQGRSMKKTASCMKATELHG